MILAATASLALVAATPAVAGTGDAEMPLAYTPITWDGAAETITLTGHDLTLEQLMRIARHGAKIRLSPEAKQRSADAYGLLLQAAAASSRLSEALARWTRCTSSPSQAHLESISSLQTTR